MGTLRDKRLGRVTPPRIDDLLGFGPEESEEVEFSQRVERLQKKLAELRIRIDRLTEPQD